MLSDETISNIRLHRDTRLEQNARPFIVSSASKQQRRLPIERAQSSRSSKSAVDAKTRAVSDSCMAAAIGDLQWLKQSIRDGPIGSGEVTSVEQTYGKEGLAPIHLAALHGRLNCLTYLVDTVHIDIDLPSSTGWRPIHLAISKETGPRSFQCVQYLVAKQAKINIANDDQLTPLHQAASEGHVQCLELLLAHDADVYVEDSRKQLPIDLAKLWGHKKCAKLLAAAMWHQNKHLSAKERLLSRNTKMADILLEIKREHAILFEEKTEEKFDEWLVNVGTGSGIPKTKQESKCLTFLSVLFLFVHCVFLGTKPLSPEMQQDQEQSNSQMALPKISQEHVINQSQTDKSTIPKRNRPATYVNRDRWNTSTHARPNPYVPNLLDNYPRDPFTKMPPKRDAIEIYRLLQRMSLDDVKKFLSKRKEPLADTTSGQENKQRPVVYAACHVDDIQTLHKPRKGEESFRPLRHFDESGLHFTDDARQSIFYQQLSEAMAGGGENTSQARRQTADEKAKWALFAQYGSELIDFLTDRHGRFKRQYDKVFIT
ncbi:unnamed protein product [Rotaria magnacalcarata]|uniref:Ankyrin repeat domain-containing protein 53 n=1 Tax=Rotaria magnacalcarata TaxID=392030 RepID=A0A815XUK1_9BILA|nr:unnamed protein product [Rotaria magnacalcarata]CAF1561777.1 unnamed protein product [Rotaria magnacalcarata]CAF4181245.1 unnamed protein product [Rotaria magnacalcarata]CAF4306033.1 unnamed protein product [Rotaria magnacalcarata]